MTPTLGRIVMYRLAEDDVEQILRQREFRGSAFWLPGNPVRAGEEFPAMMVAVWEDESLVNLQVFLDGEDTLWVTSRVEGREDGTWHWPDVKPSAEQAVMKVYRGGSWWHEGSHDADAHDGYHRHLHRPDGIIEILS